MYSVGVLQDVVVRNAAACCHSDSIAPGPKPRFSVTKGWQVQPARVVLVGPGLGHIGGGSFGLSGRRQVLGFTQGVPLGFLAASAALVRELISSRSCWARVAKMPMVSVSASGMSTH